MQMVPIIFAGNPLIYLLFEKGIPFFVKPEMPSRKDPKASKLNMNHPVRVAIAITSEIEFYRLFVAMNGERIGKLVLLGNGYTHQIYSYSQHKTARIASAVGRFVF